MTKWQYRCSLEWLEARQRFLTATDVKDLLPVTKTGRPRTVDDEAYLKVFARKVTKLTESDCLSTGAMARGHILEPYAIDLYNREFGQGDEYLYHWDDKILAKHCINGALAFSPDAMTLSPNSNLLLKDAVVQTPGFAIKTVGEVKSYSAERHLIAGYTDKMDLEERWQLATALATLDIIEKAVLMFYNPTVGDQLFVMEYDREDLADEIEIVKTIEKNWIAWVNNLGTLACNTVVKGNWNAELAIIKEITSREKFELDEFKTVIA